MPNKTNLCGMIWPITAVYVGAKHEPRPSIGTEVNNKKEDRIMPTKETYDNPNSLNSIDIFRMST